MRYLLIGLLGMLTLGIVYSCQKETSIEYGTAAKGSLQSSAGDCLPKNLAGTYAAATPLNDSNYLEVTVNVTATGPYTIFTDTVNGYAFKATGTFSATGANTVRLKGGGTPAAAGTDDFTVFFDSSFCEVSVPVNGGTSSGCGTAVVQGTYTAGTTVTAANTVTLTHTYAAAGSYSVSTNTVNGYSFGPSSYTATTGSNTVTLTATGTPTAAGTNSFSIDFGDGQSCSFTVTVGGTVTQNTDYFPTTQGSYWTYDDGTGADTFKITVNGTQAITVAGTSQTYQKFVYSDAGGTFYTEFYRKDAVGNYFQVYDTTGLGAGGITLSQPNFEIRFLQNSLTTGATWNSDVTNVTLAGTPGGTLRFVFTRVADNGSVTVNGKTFTNIYKIQLQVKAGFGTNLQSAAQPQYFYYAKGVGLVLIEDQNGAAQQAIRYWQVN
jgi:hypothetical protein